VTEKKYLIADGHLDLSMNALEWNRDLRWTVRDIRESEQGMTDKPDRAKGTVSLPAMRAGNIGLCVATQIGRYVKPGNNLPGWRSPEQAWAQTQGQLAWYNAMEEAGEMVRINNTTDLEHHLMNWDDRTGEAPVGYVLSLEGADSIISLNHLEKAFENGLRAIGPAHYGPGTYAGGTGAKGGIGRKGKELLKEIEKLGLILDATHLCDDSFNETMNLYKGPVWASHNNCRVFVPDERQISDDQIRELIKRGAVIGIALDAWMMVPGWIRGKSDPVAMNVSLKQAVMNIDHICQIAGNSLHAAIGSDLDGAFGKEQCPYDLDTITDLQKLPSMLLASGFKDTDVNNIMSDNWIRFLKQNLPAG
jgi:membrane dipeptidase